MNKLPLNEDAQEELDDQIISKIGGAVRKAMIAKEELGYALSEALDTSSEFGYQLGVEDTKAKLIQAFEDADSACCGWAVAIVEKTL